MKKVINKAALLLIILTILPLCFSCGGQNSNFYIFDDISECENLEKTEYSEINVKKYTDPQEDKYLENLEYEAFYAAEFKSSELEFEIFAYEFDDPDTAKKYFENVTGKSRAYDTDFSSEKGMTQYRLVVIDFEKAYIVYTSRSSYNELNQALGSVFSKTIT